MTLYLLLFHWWSQVQYDPHLFKCECVVPPPPTVCYHHVHLAIVSSPGISVALAMLEFMAELLLSGDSHPLDEVYTALHRS